MCRYAFVNYKQTYACFECRKAFKKTNFPDYLRQRDLSYVVSQMRRTSNKQKLAKLEAQFGASLDEIVEEYQSRINICPECGGRMANMGMDFKVPRQADVQTWSIIQGMYRLGTAFQTCGCNGFGYVPASRPDYHAYLDNMAQEYTMQLQRVQDDPSLSSFQRQERVNFWLEKFRLVDNEKSQY